MIQVKLIDYGSADYVDAVSLRTEILRKPLGLSFSQEELGMEFADTFVAAFQEGDMVGCLILTEPVEGETRMRQVAVSERHQGLGIGRQMVDFAETECRLRNIQTIRLHARESAVNFYLRQGYETEGEPFVEIGIPHRTMAKRLS